MSFKKFELHEGLYRAIDELGFVSPTPIQEKAIPPILNRSNLRISADTGTGKTATFILPALQRVVFSKTKGKGGPSILILVPTRELAMQVAGEVSKFSKYLSYIKTVCIFGGTPYPIQNRQLSRPYDILVATPGRLIDHLNRNRISLKNVEMFILDEADRMLDMGFIEPVEQIASMIPKERQTLLFSATLKGNIIKLSQKLMQESIEIRAAPQEAKRENISQRLYFADNLEHKYKLLDHLLSDQTIDQAIIFTSTKRFAEILADELLDQGRHAAVLHGDMNQRQRNRAIIRMRKKEIQILVATDVAARGIDILTITHVINFDLPNSIDDYIHRIGRTGRAGAKGLAFSFASLKDRDLIQQIERLMGQKIIPEVIPGLEPSLKPFHRPSSPKRFHPRKRGKNRENNQFPHPKRKKEL